MLIKHILAGKSEEKRGEAGFILTNKRADYFMGFSKPKTSYQGLHFFDPKEWEYYKVIDEILLDKKPDKLINKFYEVNVERDKGKETYWMADDGLILDLSDYDGYCTIDLDFRRIHDYDDQGREYNIKSDDKFIIVEYTKAGEKHYLAILGGVDFEPASEWVKKEYDYDKNRGGKHELYVYRGIRIKVGGYTRLVFSYARNETVAKVKAMQVEKKSDEHKEHIINRRVKHLDKDDLAHNCALHSIEGLTINPNKLVQGIFAGLPWFYQFWSRDELISSTYYLVEQRYHEMKDCLMKYLAIVMDDGRLPNRYPHSELGSADGIGWLWKRFLDLITSLEQRKQLDSYLTRTELHSIFDKLEQSINALNEKYSKDGMIWNAGKETWMDTSFEYDTREGARIEIQALHLASYKLAHVLCTILGNDHVQKYEVLERKTREHVRSRFFDENRLADGITEEGVDNTQRPNLFMAYYAYPELLEDREWKKAFKYALKKLWLDWGGLSTIDKESPLYSDEYTGMNNISYHRGDSWYFVNYMAAICLHRTSPAGFKEYVDKIIEAGRQEILFSGLLGQGAEVSSAKELRSEGCLCQAWSAALFCELMSLVKGV